MAPFTAGQILTAGQLGDGPNTYTPQLTATTTNPTLGVDATQSATWYRILPHLIHVWGRIQFGTSGVNPGSGQYRINLPAPASATWHTFSTDLLTGTTIGGGALRENGVLGGSPGAIYHLADANNVWIIATDAGARVSDSFPWTWDVSDAIVFDLYYLIDA